MGTQALFLAWQDKKPSRQWFPIGRLDADVEHSEYRFRYTVGAARAQKAGFPLAIEFPKLRENYHSSELFPLFKNRVIAPGRPDRVDYLSYLDLQEDANPVEILSASGGHRVTDSFEVFPKIETRGDGSFRCRFFLHGRCYVNADAQKRTKSLEPEERLYVTLELTNPATDLAVQIQTADYHMIGWAPCYLVDDLAQAMAENPDRYAAHVVRVNPLPPPSKQRLLIELNGHCSHEPMSGSNFKPLVD